MIQVRQLASREIQYPFSEWITKCNLQDTQRLAWQVSWYNKKYSRWPTTLLLRIAPCTRDHVQHLAMGA